MDIKVNSVVQKSKSLLDIVGTGLNKRYISILIDGIVSKITYRSYRKISVSIPQTVNLSEMTVNVHLFVNERNNRHYIDVGPINGY